MATLADIGPGARVRTQDGFIGTVELLEQHSEGPAGTPDRLIIRADEGDSRYRIPLSLVGKVRRRDDHTIVYLELPADSLPRYEVTQPDENEVGRSPASEREVWGPQTHQERLHIPLATEELSVRTQPFTAGTVSLHKGVETFQQRLTVPVQHEEVVVERIPPDQLDPDAPHDPDVTIIPIMEERVVVQKQTVVREYVRLRKQKTAEEREIASELRREYVDVSQQHADGTSAGPSLRYPADSAVEPNEAAPSAL